MSTNRGDIGIQLDNDKAPCTVNSFASLAQQGYFDGTTCHRLTTSPQLAVLQCGDPSGSGTGGPGYKIDCETAGNPYKHELGALSMAHAGKNTGGSQFFIVLDEKNTRHLNGVHTVFGKVTGGLDIVKQIKPNDTMSKVRVPDSLLASKE